MASPRHRYRRASASALALPLTWALAGCFLFGYEELSPSDNSPRQTGQDASTPLPVQDDGGLSSGPDTPDASSSDAGSDDPFGDGFDGLLPDASASGQAPPMGCPWPASDCQSVCTDEDRQCTVDCSMATRCDADCQANTQCHVACSGVNSCDLVCARGSRCALDCSHTNHDSASSCDVSCEAGARCAIDCHESNRCAVSCAAQAACAIDCRKSNNCRDVVCARGAACLLYCPDSNCSQAACLGDAKTCPDGTIACGVECPLPDAWNWDEFSYELGSHHL